MNKNIGLIFINVLLASFLFSACAGGKNPLDGTSWQLNKYQQKNRELVTIHAESVITAQFQAEKVSGIASCNNYSASYQVEGKKLSFGPVAATRKFCAEPLGIMEQEDDFLMLLSQVQSFNISGSTLEMKAEDGKTVLIFSVEG